MKRPSKSIVFPSAVVILQVWMLLINTAGAEEPCSLCSGGRAVPEEHKSTTLFGDIKCSGMESAARFHDESDPMCEEYFHFIGISKCGCGEGTDSEEATCNICLDGNPPPLGSNIIDLTLLGPWKVDNVTCDEVNNYLTSYAASTGTCSKYQELGVDICGCPDSSPSASPSYTDEKEADCESLGNGIFPTIDSQYAEGSTFDYELKLDLNQGVTLTDITSSLLEQMSITVSLEAVKGCSASDDFIIRLDDFIIHSVQFTDLVERASGAETMQADGK